MQHGLFDSGDTWVNHYPNLAPAFQLANAGYDVFLGNNRGNQYSNRHKTLDPIKDDKKFHDYSFVEYGKYDLPAQINSALAISGNQKLTYVGHS